MGNSYPLNRQNLFSPVHPHVHGELTPLVSRSYSATGSSPRAWGTRNPDPGRRPRGRFIPTCMGNSRLSLTGDTGTTVHPHVHGELMTQTIRPGKKLGSSPRAWGTRKLEAYLREAAAVHPHVHGELLPSLNWLFCPVGSSPRAWGTPLVVSYQKFPLRFIPTCMGNSGGSMPSSRAISVHPHVHGELTVSSTSGTSAAGSSPRAWGTLRRGAGVDDQDRFIPTCMGNSPAGPWAPASGSVHPHVHGELWIWWFSVYVMGGSSPRAWGTLPK